MIKKLILFLALLPLFASAQLTPAQDTILISGATPFTPQFRFKNVTLSGVNYRIPQVYNSLLGKYDTYVTTKYLSAFYAPLSGLGNYVQFGTTTSATNYVPFLNDSNRVVVNLSGLRYLSSSNRYLSGIRADFTNGLRSSLAPTSDNEVLRWQDTSRYAKTQIYTANTIYRGNGTTSQVPSNITDDGQYIVLDAKTGGQVELNHNGQQKVVVDDNTTYVFNDLNVTSLNTGTTADDFVVSNGGLIKKRAASTVANPADSKYKNILTYGGNPNGIADNTAAFYAAKGAGNTIIYFPQNAAGNAKYYFSDGAPLYIFGLTIDSDPGVLIDAPYYQSGGGQYFSSNVTLLLRGIQDTVKYYANTPGPKQLHINDADYDKSKVSPLLNTQVVTGAFNWGGNTGPAFEGSLVDTSRVRLNSGVATGTLNYVGYNIGIGDELNGNFTPSSAGTNSGAFVKFKDNSWIYFNDGGTSGFGTYAYHYKPLGGTFVETTVAKNIGFAVDYYLSYAMSKSLITIRKINKTTFAILVNGKEFFERFDYGKEIDLVGFANYNTATTSIVENITTTINKVAKGRTNVVVDIYGDSKSEKSIASWDRYFQETVNNTNGVRIQKVNNYAISGNDIKNQYNLFHARGVSGIDAVIVSLGTNDIQNGSSPDTCLKYLNKFYTEVIGQGKKLLVVNPTLWYSYALAGNTGQNTTNFDNGSTTRGAITFWAANHPLVKYVDIMPTTPEAIFNKGLLIDNIHPQDELNRINGVDIAKAFMSAWETQNEPIEPKFSQYATISRKGANVDSLNFSGKIIAPVMKTDTIKVTGKTINDILLGDGSTVDKNTYMPKTGGTFSNSVGDYGIVKIINTNTNGEAAISFGDVSDSDPQKWVTGKNVGGRTDDSYSWYRGGEWMNLSNTGVLSVVGGIKAFTPTFTSGTPLLVVKNGTTGFYETVTQLPNNTKAATPVAAGDVANLASIKSNITDSLTNNSRGFVRVVAVAPITTNITTVGTKLTYNVVADAAFKIETAIDITAIVGNNLRVEVNYTSLQGVARTIVGTSYNTATWTQTQNGAGIAGGNTFMAKGGTAITVVVTNPTLSAGTQTYDFAASLIKYQ